MMIKEVIDLIKIDDSTFVPVREGETREEVINTYKERQEKYLDDYVRNEKQKAERGLTPLWSEEFNLI